MATPATISDCGRTGFCRLRALACIGAGLVLLAQTVSAQETGQPPSEPPAQAAKPEPGLFESIGRWMDQGAANWRDHWRGAKERWDDLGGKAASASKDIGTTAAEVGKGAADATRSAVNAMVKLPGARLVQGRQTCPVAPNGAPDCQIAAETLCKARGFSTGQSMDYTSAEKCPPRAWASGRSAHQSECTTETFITRAMCQ
jgi:hypothetical protein